MAAKAINNHIAARGAGDTGVSRKARAAGRNSVSCARRAGGVKCRRSRQAWPNTAQ